MRIRYTPEAREDLRAIRRYIGEDRQNPSSAEDTVKRIIQECGSLKQMPNMGAPLSSRINRDSPYRYLVIGYHIAFYRIDAAKDIVIARILDGRTQFVSLLFGGEIGLD